jgi:hypothetical protein
MRLICKILLTTLIFPATAMAENIAIKLDAQWNGVKVGDMTVTANEQGGKYEYSAIVESAGLLRAFTKYRSENIGKGLINNGIIIPESYFTQWWRKKEHQQIDVAYTNNGKTVDETATPPEKRPKRPIVEHKDKDSTFDPVTAAIIARSQIKELVAKKSEFPQKITIPVFDARRRFDVQLTVNGYKKKYYKGKKQQLLEIVFFREPGPGFNDKEIARMKTQDPTVTFYLNEDFLPVLGSGAAPFGRAEFTLTASCQKEAEPCNL